MRRSSTAALALGLYAGAIAGLAVLPAALLALILHAYHAYDLALEQATAVAEARAMVHRSGVPSRLARLPHLRAIVVLDDGDATMEFGSATLAAVPPLAPQLVSLCDSPHARLFDVGGVGTWAWSCAESQGTRYLIGVEPDIISIPRVVILIFGLAAVVGLITSLLIRRALAPLGQISRGLARVTAGERNVRLSLTGMTELDDLIARVNATARAVEEREDHITAQIKTAQRMARVIAHEVRNPLQSLEMLLAVLVEEPRPEERERIAEAMREEVQLLDQVVARMLKRSIGEDLELHPARFDLSRLIDHLYELHAPAARVAGLTLTTSVERPLPLVADQALLGRCLENLVLNALQHARSRVSINAGIRTGHATIEVADDGAGIDPLVADRLFEANVSQRSGGSGIGLALVHAVVQAHGGQVSADHAPGGGARFILIIPTQSAEAGTGVPPASPPS